MLRQCLLCTSSSASDLEGDNVPLQSEGTPIKLKAAKVASPTGKALPSGEGSTSKWPAPAVVKTRSVLSAAVSSTRICVPSMRSVLPDKSAVKLPPPLLVSVSGLSPCIALRRRPPPPNGANEPTDSPVEMTMVPALAGDTVSSMTGPALTSITTGTAEASVLIRIRCVCV